MDIGMLVDSMNEVARNPMQFMEMADKLVYVIREVSNYVVQYGEPVLNAAVQAGEKIQSFLQDGGEEFLENIAGYVKDVLSFPAGRVLAANTVNVLVNTLTKYLQKTEDKNHKDKHIGKTYIVTGLINLIDLFYNLAVKDPNDASLRFMIEPAITAATTFGLTHVVQKYDPKKI